jgi:hypothetical protein
MVQHGLDVRTSVANSSFRLHERLSSGRIGEQILTPDFKCNPTSALSFRTEILKQVLPLPFELRTGADWYLCVITGLLTKISAIQEPLGVYWVHGENHFTNNRTAESLKQQLVTINLVRELSKKVAISNGLKIPERFEANHHSEYPVFCRINLAWQEREFHAIPGYFLNYVRKYAIPEYGWSLRLLRRSFRMAACALLPPPLYRKLGFYSHG